MTRAQRALPPPALGSPLYGSRPLSKVLPDEKKIVRYQINDFRIFLSSFLYKMWVFLLSHNTWYETYRVKDPFRSKTTLWTVRVAAAIARYDFVVLH